MAEGEGGCNFVVCRQRLASMVGMCFSFFSFFEVGKFCCLVFEQPSLNMKILMLDYPYVDN